MLALPAFAQQKEEETPFWAIGRPKAGPGAQMAPVPAFPVPTPADKLPIAKMKVPEGFKVEVYAAEILDARGLREGDKGTVFVSSLFVAGKLYAIVDKGGKREVKTLAEKLFLPNGIEFHKGSLYLATPKDITRYDKIEDNLDKLPTPVMINDQLPGEVPHGWKFIKIGPDGKLYVPVGAPCNICDPDSSKYAQIRRMNLDGSGMEIVARGVRNTVGFDFHPKTGELWFTDNQRDWLSEDMPNDELNRPHQGRAALRLSVLSSGRLRRSRVRVGQVLRRLHQARDLARAAFGSARDALLHGQDVPVEVPGRDLHRASRAVEPHQEVRGRRRRGVPRPERQGDEGRAVPDGSGREQQLPRPPGGRHGDEGRLACWSPTTTTAPSIGSATRVDAHRRGESGLAALAPSHPARHVRGSRLRVTRRRRVSRGAHDRVPGLSRRRRALANPGDAVARRPAAVLHGRPAVPVP